MIYYFRLLIVAEEERKVRIIEEDISVKQKICEEDLVKAEPALQAAQAALNTLNKVFVLCAINSDNNLNGWLFPPPKKYV